MRLSSVLSFLSIFTFPYSSTATAAAGAADAGTFKFKSRRSISSTDHIRKPLFDAESSQNSGYRFLPPAQASLSGEGGTEDGLELLDIALAASIDGAFHAIHRASGHVVWSMSSMSSTSIPADVLAPLVRTHHPNPTFDPRHSYNSEHAGKDGEERDGELYIVEPQSGAIFVLPSQSTSAPLQKLPFTMQQLVDMSPFSLPGDEEHRLFVGRKESRILVLELETGKVKGVVGNGDECPWDPFEEFGLNEREIDLDELEERGTRDTKPVSTEVLIGRTDYTVTIHTRSRDPSLPRPPSQTLTFSTYGPNNQDTVLQASYHRTPDDTYIQPMANGELMAFRATVSGSSNPKTNDEDEEQGAHPIWGNSFTSPVVAVFDVLLHPSSSRRSSTFLSSRAVVLLQPTPRIHEFIPSFSASTNLDLYDLDGEATFVGLVREESRESLYAMSPDRFPLVVFAQPNFQFSPQYTRSEAQKRVELIDAPPGYVPDPSLESEFDGESDYPVAVDEVTRLLKARAKCAPALEGTRMQKECLLGKRPVVASSQSRLSRLLPDRPNLPPLPGEGSRGGWSYGEAPGLAEGNRSEGKVAEESEEGLVAGLDGKKLSGGALAILLILLSVWYFARSASPSSLTVALPVLNPASSLDLSLVANQEQAVLVKESSLSYDLSSSKDPVSQASKDFGIVLSPSTKDIPSIPNLQANGQTSPSPVSGLRRNDTTLKLNSNVNGPAEADESDHDGDDTAEQADGGETAPEKKKGTRRRRRGKKNKGGEKVIGSEAEKDVGEIKEEKNVLEANVSTSMLAPQEGKRKVPLQLVVSDDVLGYGSHGTVVFRGSLQGRDVAVKRLLKDFVTLAQREVALLTESDDHPNVIRYFYQEAHADFLYIALELCPASLADVIEHPDQHRDLSAVFEPKKALSQVLEGIRHLHALKIIHRDIKPQNILISAAKRGAGASTTGMKGHRCLISDFGLCKRLEVDQTSFAPTIAGAGAAGTAGWRAPEILRGEVNVDDPSSLSPSETDDSTLSSKGSTGTVSGQKEKGKGTRLTKSVDVFALGCLAYYVLTSGGHPYGDRFERDVNIIRDAKDLSGLKSFGEEGLEAIDLIQKMLDAASNKRPDTPTCLAHPFFWTSGRRLSFLQDASDRFEIMCREPRESDLIELERNAHAVVGHDWQNRLDRVFLENLGKFRKYDGKSVQDLMRALRNKKHHYQDLPDNVKRQLGPLPDGFLGYFTRRFPHLFMHVHSVVARTNLRYESMFKAYFDPPD